jgi:DNA polymerase-2
VLSLSREIRRDVFLPEPIPVLQAVVDNSVRQARLFREVQKQFPLLTYYDADIAVTTRHAALHGSFPMAFCEIEAEENFVLHSLRVLNSRWDPRAGFPRFSPCAARA